MVVCVTVFFSFYRHDTGQTIHQMQPRAYHSQTSAAIGRSITGLYPLTPTEKLNLQKF